MTDVRTYPVNPELDLVLDRYIDVRPELVWAAYTTPELLMQWFCPKPWGVSACTIDLWPGGQFASTFRSPEGDEFPNVGCFLEVVANRRLVWTDALHPGFRPAAAAVTGADGLMFTAAITLVAEGAGTRYTAHAMHADAASQQKHAAMGFYDGWGATLDQLEALMQER